MSFFLHLLSTLMPVTYEDLQPMVIGAHSIPDLVCDEGHFIQCKTAQL